MTTSRSGFASLVGRPNAGKSTLTNALVGEKIAITSSRPQTTRHAVRGILTRPDAQLVLVDTPGLHRPRTLLGQRLNAVVRETWADVDVIALCLPADEPVGAGDRFIARELAALPDKPVLAVVTKTDLVEPPRVAAALVARSSWASRRPGSFADIVPVSAVVRVPGRPAGRPAHRPAAGGPAALPGQRADRRADRDPDRRADPGGGAGGRTGRAAALAGGLDRRDVPGGTT